MLNLKSMITAFFKYTNNFGFNYFIPPSTNSFNSIKEVSAESPHNFDSKEQMHSSVYPRLSKEEVHFAIMEACDEALNEYGDIIDALADC